MDANKGYMGWSMSVRAAKALENLEMPKTVLKKHYKISEKTFREMLLKDMIDYAGYHHKSKFFNEVDHYVLNIHGYQYLFELGKLSEEILNDKIAEETAEMEYIIEARESFKREQKLKTFENQFKTEFSCKELNYDFYSFCENQHNLEVRLKKIQRIKSEGFCLEKKLEEFDQYYQQLVNRL